MGVGPDGACGGSSGGGDSWAHSTAAATRASASETGARTLIMAAGWYDAAESRPRDRDGRRRFIEGGATSCTRTPSHAR